MPGWLTVIDTPGCAVQRTGERHPTDAGRGQRGCFADLSLAQVDVLAVDRMLLLAWLPGWLLVIVLEEVLQVDNGRAGQCGGLLFCPLHRLMCWR